MHTYHIESKAGVEYGTYQAETSAEAFAAMCRDAGYDVRVDSLDTLIFADSDTAAVCGSPVDWTIYREY